MEEKSGKVNLTAGGRGNLCVFSRTLSWNRVSSSHGLLAISLAGAVSVTTRTAVFIALRPKS